MTAQVIPFPIERRGFYTSIVQPDDPPCQILILPVTALPPGSIRAKRRLACPIDFNKIAEQHRADIARHFGLRLGEVHFGLDRASAADLTTMFRFDKDGRLLDGHHRLHAMKELGLYPPGF